LTFYVYPSHLYVKHAAGGLSNIVGYHWGLMSAIADPLIPDENWSQYAAMLHLVVIGMRDNNENNILGTKTFREAFQVEFS
jgi:hypothetical protein